MPDTSASRKRQIQITPRTFRGTGASRAFLTDGRYPVSRVWAHVSKLCGLGGTWTARQSARAGAVRALSLRGVSAAWLPHALSKSREIDSMSPAGRFDSRRRSRFQIAARKRRAWPLYKGIPLAGNVGLPAPFAGFLSRLGGCRRQGSARSPCPHAMNRVR